MSNDSVRGLISEAEGYFRHKGVDAPLLCAQLIMARALGLERVDLHLAPERVPDPEQLDRFRFLVTRRGHGEPLAYILGVKEFYGLDFAVNRHALIPRPETELLVECAEARFDKDEAFDFADLGTGSGCIAVSLAARFPNARGTAVDLSPKALDTARDNARTHGVSARIDFVEGDFSVLPDQGRRFALVAANPPYVTEAEFEELDIGVSAYEPQMALVAGPDGLDAVRAATAVAADVLAPEGIFLMEFGCTQGGAVGRIVRGAGFQNVRIHKDLAGLDRFVEARFR